MMRLLQCCFVFLLFIGMAIAAPNVPVHKVDNYISPPPQKPITVHIKTKVIDVLDIDEHAEFFTVKLSTSLRWKDERLRFDPNKANTDIKLFQDDDGIKDVFFFWRPVFNHSNSTGSRDVSTSKLAITPDGTVHYMEIYTIQIEHPMNLVYYPFDKQKFDIYLNIINAKSHPIIIKKETKPSIFYEPIARQVNIAQWNYLGMKDEAKKSLTRKNLYYYKLQIRLERKPMHIITRVYIPIIIFTLLSFIIFWVSPKSVIDRINLSLIGLLSIVTYQVIVQDYLPPVSDVIPIDIFVYLSFLFVIINIFITMLLYHFYTKRKMRVIHNVDLVCRYVFPIAYLIVAIGLLLASVLSSGSP